MNNKMSWVDEEAEKMESGGKYFKIVEGDNRVQLLTHCAPLPQVWTGTQYRVAGEGDQNISIKGVCYLLQDGVIKEAKLPYTVVKSIRELMQDPDYAFEEFPMPRLINIRAKNAGSKEVEYSVIPSPKETAVPQAILDELSKMPTPDDIVEKLKGKVAQEQPDDEIDPANIPF